MTNQRLDGRAGTVRTEDPHEAEAVIAEAYLPNRVQRMGVGPLDLRLSALRLDSATVGLISFGTETRLVTAEASNYHVNLPLRGGVVSRMGGGAENAAGPGRATIFMPGRPADILWGADSLQLCLMIPARPLSRTRAAARAFGFRTVGLRDRNGPLHSVGAWLASLGRGAAHRGCGVLGSRPTCAWPGSWSGWWSTAFCSDSRTTTAMPWTGESWRPPSGPVAQARQLLEEQPHEPWTTVLPGGTRAPERAVAAGGVRAGPWRAAHEVSAAGPSSPGTRPAAGCVPCASNGRDSGVRPGVVPPGALFGCVPAGLR